MTEEEVLVPAIEVGEYIKKRVASKELALKEHLREL